MSTQRRSKMSRRRRTLPATRRFGSVVPNRLYADGFPREQKVTLKYFDNLVIVTTTGLNYDHVFNLNSIHDPDRTGTGHQPYAHDSWATLYNRYRVDGVKVKVSWTNSPVGGSVCAILPNNSTTAITDPVLPVESPLSAHKVMTNGGPGVTLIRQLNLAQVNGVTRAVYNADDRYQSAFGASPVENLLLHVCTFTEISFTFYVRVEIEYYTTLFDPIQLASS